MKKAIDHVTKDGKITTDYVETQDGTLLLVIDKYFDLFLKFDIFITGFLQKLTGKGSKGKTFKYISNFVTWTFSAELLQCFLLFQLSLGIWKSKNLVLLSFVSTCILGQIPKRIWFRNRPWRLVSKFKRSEDLSSSFPSRSSLMAGSILFSNILYYHSGPMALIWSFWVYLATAISRIVLGAHFFSDCLISFILAILQNFIISLLYFHTNFGNWIENSEVAPYAITVFLSLLIITFNLPSVKFWDKASPVFGGFLGVHLVGQGSRHEKTPVEAIFYQNPLIFTRGIILILFFIVVGYLSLKYLSKYRKELGKSYFFHHMMISVMSGFIYGGVLWLV